MLGQSGLETKLLALQFLLHLRQPADLTNALLRHSRKAFSEKFFHHHFGYISHCLKTVARVLAFDCFVQELLLIVVYAHALSSFRMSNPVTFPCGCEMLQKFVLCRQEFFGYICILISKVDRIYVVIVLMQSARLLLMQLVAEGA